MNSPRWPIIVRAIVRLVAGSALIPAFLIAGLLSVPATCQCGSSLPHDHSLFAIAYHAHDHAGTGGAHPHPHAAGTAESPDDASAARNASEARVSGSSLQVATDFASGQARALYLPVDAPSIDAGRIGARFDDATTSAAWLISPDSPPPQA